VANHFIPPLQPTQFSKGGQHGKLGTMTNWFVGPTDKLILYIDSIDDYYYVSLNNAIIASGGNIVPQGLDLTPLLNKGSTNVLRIQGENNPGQGWNFWHMTYRIALLNSQQQPIRASIEIEVHGGPTDGGEFLNNSYYFDH